jgi:hypothetical protein
MDKERDRKFVTIMTKKMDMRFRTWSIRSIYKIGAINSVIIEMENYRMELVGVQETIRGFLPPRHGASPRVTDGDETSR